MASDSTPYSATSSQAAPGLTDASLMRQAAPDLLSLALMEARNHTLTLFGQYQKALEGVDFRVPPTSGVKAPLWTLGHVGWFQEWWIARNMCRAQGIRCDPTQARLGSIEPMADAWWGHAASPTAGAGPALPDAGHCRAYLLDTLESTLELLAKVGPTSDDALYFYRLCLFHEDMQAEVLAQDAQTLGLPLDRFLLPAYTPSPLPLREPLLLPATRWQMGIDAAAAGFAFDNEMPAHAVDVPAFEIDAQVVSWSQYVEFVGDGGYDQEALWHTDGWAWLQQQSAGGDDRRAPRHVEQIGVASGAVMQTRFGQSTRMLGQQPALHVSWWEADAWCRWAGRRLPSEVEWELAAMTAARRGFRTGDVWEWMGTTFRGYPGYSPGPLGAADQAAFGTHKVLRGGSFATRARMKHPRQRQFALPGQDALFCGFRSCAL